MNTEIKFKQDVLTAFQKESPSKVDIEQDEEFNKYVTNHYNLFFHKLKFPPELFRGKKIIDFGCGTGEVDIVLGSWGAYVEGFDFNPDSIARAQILSQQFSLTDKLCFSEGDVDTYKFDDEHYDITISMGVIAHVPNQKNMFERMARSCREGGFLILGYIEKSGLIQRLLHRAICLANKDGEEELYKIAKMCFGEHIKRSVKYGGRNEKSVINDYLINPHYHGIDVVDLLKWAAFNKMEYYGSWPDINVPFGVDSPYFLPMDKKSDDYRSYFSFLKLRWMYAQLDDGVVTHSLFKDSEYLKQSIDNFIENVYSSLQQFDYSAERMNKISEAKKRLDEEFNRFSSIKIESIHSQITELNDEVVNLLSILSAKVNDGINFDLTRLPNKLFKGYNGLGTSYIIFHKVP